MSLALVKDMEIDEIATYAQNGDTDSIEYLIRFFEPTVKMYIREKQLFLPREEFQDLLQEGKIAIFKAIKSFDIDKKIPFAGFVCMVIKRKLFESIKMRNRLKHQFMNYACSFEKYDKEDPFDIFFLNDETNNSNNPELVYLRKDNYQTIIHTIIQDLTELEIKVFWGYFVYQLKPKEIAKNIGRTPKCIDNTIRRIKIKVSKYENEFLNK